MFITFEGSEGSGKSTQFNRLHAHLLQAGYPVIATREPGGTPIGDQVRSVLMDFKNAEMHPRTEALLFQASRAQLVEQVIRPALAGDQIVLCDRYGDSTLAYQGYGYRQNLDLIRNLVDFATGGLKPDLTLLLDLDVEDGLRRKIQAGQINRLDSLDKEVYQRVREAYLHMAQEEPWRWVIVDAAPPPDQVQAAVLKIVLERLNAEQSGFRKFKPSGA